MWLFAKQFDLIDTIARLAETDRTTVWHGLLVGLVLSGIYLFTLMTTRWGERHALVKACVFSVLIHVFSTLGWVAVAEPRLGESEIVSDEEPVETFEITVIADTAYEIPQTGTTPVWDRNVRALETQMTRTDPDREQIEFRDAERTEAEVPTRTPDVRDITKLPDAATDTPSAERIDSKTLAQAIPFRNDVPEPLKNEASPPVTPPRERTADSETSAIAPEVTRRVESFASLDRDVRLPALPEPRTENSDRPAPLNPFVDPPRVNQPISPVTDAQPQQLPRANQTAPQPARERDVVDRQPGIDTGVDRAPRAGASDTTPRDVEPGERVIAMNAVRDPQAMLRTSKNDDIVQRRSAPAPQPGILPDLGTPGASGDTQMARGVPDLIRSRTQPLPRQPKFSGAPERRRTSGGELASAVPTRSGFATPRYVPLTPAGTRDVPQVVRPESVRGMLTRKVTLPAIYAYRGPEQRRLAALRFGGTRESEDAVEMALKWLAYNQEPAGFWNARRHGAGRVALDDQQRDTRGAPVREVIPGARADSAVTALALLAFLGAGHTQDDGAYTTTVRRAIDWLVEQQRADGFLGGNASHYARTYSHAMATYALAESYGMRSDPESNRHLKPALEKAVMFIIKQQGSDGGWRYEPNQDGDMSIFGWNLMALKSAEIAGIPISETVHESMKQFLRSQAKGEDGGLAAYNTRVDGKGFPTPTMTAEALFCNQMYGRHREHPASLEAIGFLQQRLPTRQNYDLYYWYYGTLSMFQFGGAPWASWNSRMRDILVIDQRTRGELAGSWDPKGLWGGYGGRVYSTAMSALCLEVYYRFLPLYKSKLRDK